MSVVPKCLLRWSTFGDIHINFCLEICMADLDHTADIQLHCWGKTITDAFMHMAPCMFNYMTDLSRVVIDKEKTIEFTVKGAITDMHTARHFFLAFYAPI